MAAELGILVIHGMGSQAPDFAAEMIEEINGRIDDLGKDPGDIAWQPIHWADILEPRQSQYLRDAKRSADLNYVSIRRFLLSAFGDASGYQQVKGSGNNTYDKIHKRVKNKIKSLYVTGLGSKNKPMLILAHSLGGHIMSNYVWDMQNSDTSGMSPFERMDKLSGMVTFGCNIPFFTFAYDDVIPIEFPPAGLSQALKNKAKWLNYYDSDDVLGYPLKSINPAYDNTVSEDISINVGGLFSSWNPLSHNEYWTDNDFTKPVSQFIKTFL